MSASSTVLPPKFDVTDPALRADPYPVYARLRATGAACRGAPGQWVLTRHADVAAMLHDRRLTKQLPPAYYRVAGASPALESFLVRMNLGRRDHRLARRVGEAFRAPAVAGLAERMRGMVDALLDEALPAGSFDIAQGLALRFPMMVMCELIGIPAADREALWPHAAALLASFSDAAFLSERELARADRSLAWMQEYLQGLLDERRRRPADDLVSSLARSGDGEQPFSAEQVVDSAIRVFYAGFETSKAMLCNGLAALLAHPEQMRRLRAEPALVPSAVDESLRYDAPIQVSLRLATETVSVAGRRIHEGRVLVLLIGSANRDERRFADPDRFDVTRRPNPHLSFGGGPNYCLGAALARQEGVVALGRLLARTRAIELDGEPQRPALVNLRCWGRLPIRVRPS
ncbi:MAG: cytochrome P450 [Solirubrobacteraceae bacterium]